MDLIRTSADAASPGWPGIGAIDADAAASDTVDLTVACRGIYVGVTGNLKVTMPDGTTPTFLNIAAGVVHPIAATRVWSTGTTATGLFAIL